MALNKFLRYASLTAFIGTGSVSSQVVAQPVADPENFRRMEWEIGHGAGIDFNNPNNPLISSGFSVNDIPLTPGKIPIFGLPSLDLSAMIESPANSFISDTREYVMGRANLFSHYIDVHRSVLEGLVFNYLHLGPELWILGTRQSSLQVYGGGSVSHGAFTSGSNSQFNERFGFLAGSDYLITAGAECIFQVTPHVSIGGSLEGIFPGVNDKFGGHLELGPRFLFNSLNHGVAVSPYFMLNGFSASESDLNYSKPLPRQVGIRISYHGFEKLK